MPISPGTHNVWNRRIQKIEHVIWQNLDAMMQSSQELSFNILPSHEFTRKEENKYRYE
jgi:hypothetical protein